jgi:hypothetical protein
MQRSEGSSISLPSASVAFYSERSRSWIRTKAQEGKIPRYSQGGESRYYVYDLLDLTLQSR